MELCIVHGYRGCCILQESRSECIIGKWHLWHRGTSTVSRQRSFRRGIYLTCWPPVIVVQEQTNSLRLTKTDRSHCCLWIRTLKPLLWQYMGNKCQSCLTEAICPRGALLCSGRTRSWNSSDDISGFWVSYPLRLPRSHHVRGSARLWTVCRHRAEGQSYLFMLSDLASISSSTRLKEYKSLPHYTVRLK